MRVFPLLLASLCLAVHAYCDTPRQHKLTDEEYATAFAVLEQNTSYLSPISYEALVGVKDRGHLLDVGAGPGVAARLLAPYFRDYTGVEPNPIFATGIRTLGRRVIEQTWQQVAIEQTYDAVICSHVLYDIPIAQWHDFLMKLLRACNRDGVVVVALTAPLGDQHNLQLAVREDYPYHSGRLAQESLGLPAQTKWERTRHELITKTAQEMRCVARFVVLEDCFSEGEFEALSEDEHGRIDGVIEQFVSNSLGEDGLYHLVWYQDLLVLKPDRVPVHIDTDGGVDDAFAIAYISRDPYLELVGLSAVFGNVDMEQAADNCATILHQIGHSDTPPIARGCANPLIASRLWNERWPGHGSNGLGDATFDTPRHLPTEEIHGAELILRNSRTYPGMRLLAIGPLTNVALAYLLDPSLPERISELVIMGGTDTLKGNCTPAAEFNFRCDPEAADVVLTGFAGKITLVTWEQTLRTHLDWAWLENDVDDFLKQILAPLSALQQGRGYPPIICDLVAAVALAHPRACQSTPLYAAVELDGTHTRGGVVFDWYRRTGQAANVRVIHAIDE